MKTNQTFGISGGYGRQLREVKGATMIALFDGVGHAFKRRGWMIEFSCNFNTQVRVSRHGVIINHDAAIGGDELAIFSKHQRIDFKRPSFNAARGRK